MSYKTVTKESYEATAEAFAENVVDLAPIQSIERFISLLPPQATILDLGCGSGRDAKIFTEKQVNVVGIDFCSNLLDIARKTAPLAEFYEMDMEELTFSPNSFDGVWACASFCHTPKSAILNIFKKIHSILKKEGHFYLSLKHGSGEVLEKDTRYEGNIEKFWSFFEEDELKQLLQEAQFKILDLDHVAKRHAYQTHPSLRVFCQKKDTSISESNDKDDVG